LLGLVSALALSGRGSVLAATTTSSSSSTTTTAATTTTSTAPAVLALTGHGWGHGLGLSQWGAYGYAKHG
jgi:stage II sporulation protein D